MIKKIIIFIILVLAVIGTISLVNGESIGEFQLGEDVQIFQTCNNCTYCNFTRVMGLNNRTILSNLIGNVDDTYFYYNIDGLNFSDVGEYSYCYKCGNTVESSTGCLEFEITYTGGDLTLEMSLLYLGSIIFLIFLFVVIILLATQLPSSDTQDEQGAIVQINTLKHLRPILYSIDWLVVLAMLFLLSNITIAYLPTSMFGGLFFSLFTILFWVTIICVPMYWIWIFTNIFKDKEYKRMMERGVGLNSQYM